MKIRKAWRQKIEAWLSENEKEDRAGKQLQKRAKQLHQANRRSFEDSGEQAYFPKQLFLVVSSFSKTCPITESEGKNYPMNTLAENQTVLEGERFSEVYDWRPSVEKTDVIRTMEAIEGAYKL